MASLVKGCFNGYILQKNDNSRDVWVPKVLLKPEAITGVTGILVYYTNNSSRSSGAYVRHKPGHNWLIWWLVIRRSVCHRAIISTNGGVWLIGPFLWNLVQSKKCFHVTRCTWKYRLPFSRPFSRPQCHYSDVVMSSMASEITGISIACSAICSGAYQRKHKSSA